MLSYIEEPPLYYLTSWPIFLLGRWRTVSIPSVREFYWNMDWKEDWCPWNSFVGLWNDLYAYCSHIIITLVSACDILQCMKNETHLSATLGCKGLLELNCLLLESDMIGDNQFRW